MANFDVDQFFSFCGYHNLIHNMQDTEPTKLLGYAGTRSPGMCCVRFDPSSNTSYILEVLILSRRNTSQLMGVYSLVIIILIVSILVYLLAGRRFALEEKKLTQEMPLSCGEFAELLLSQEGIGYDVIKDNTLRQTGLCDFKSKRICLSFPLGSNILQALFEAGHEVGHAVQGEIPFKMPIYIFMCFIVYLTCFVSGFYGILSMPVFITGVVIFLTWWAIWWLQEINASRFAVKELLLIGADRKVLAMRLKSELIYKLICMLCFTVFQAVLGFALIATRGI